MSKEQVIAVVDLFAGPGGLGEGFSALGRPEGSERFKIRLSIEKDATAHQTLELRAFFRQLSYGDAPAEYYAFLRGEISRGELFAAHRKEAGAAGREAWNATLGGTPREEVHKRIREALVGAD